MEYDIVNFDSLEPLDNFEGYSENKECSLECGNKEILDNEEDFDDSFSGRSTSSSEVFEEATFQPGPLKSVMNLTVDSVLISFDIYDFLLQCLPNIVKGCQWVLLYR